MEQALPAIERMIRRITGAQRIGPATRLFHDLSIAGDDAGELVDQVTETFGTSFEGFPFDHYFPDESETLLAHLSRRLGTGRVWKPLTVQHLVDVVERGSWFSPP
jgi:hypothetical protein